MLTNNSLYFTILNCGIFILLIYKEKKKICKKREVKKT